MITKFITDSGFNFSAQLVSLFFGVFSSIVTARTLGVENLGLSALVLLLPTTIQALLGSGFSPTIIYMSASGKWEVKNVIPRLLGLWIYLSLLMLVVALLLVFTASTLFREAPLELLIFSLVLIPLALLDSGLVAVLSSNQQFRSILVRSLLVAPSRFITIVICLWWLGLGVTGVVAAAIISGAVGIAISAWQIQGVLKIHRFRCPVEFRASKLRPSLEYGFQASLGNLIGFLNYRADQFIISSFLGNTALGIYSIAVGLVEKLWIVASNVSGVLLPLAAGDQSNSGKVEKITVKAAVAMSALMIIMGLLLVMLAEPLVLIMYGDAYVESAKILLYLLPGIMFAGPAKLFANYVAAKGHPEYNAIRGAAALTINLGLNIFLIPEWGITGAAVATSVSYVMSSVAGAVVFYKISRASLAGPAEPTARVPAN